MSDYSTLMGINSIEAMNAVSSIKPISSPSVPQIQIPGQIEAIPQATDGETFETLLKEGIEQLTLNSQNTETNNLLGVLNQTVAGKTLNLSELSNDMLKTSSGRQVLSNLVEGQFSSIVTSSLNDNSNSTDYSNLYKDEEDANQTDELIDKMNELIEVMKAKK